MTRMARHALRLRWRKWGRSRSRQSARLLLLLLLLLLSSEETAVGMRIRYTKSLGSHRLRLGQPLWLSLVRTRAEFTTGGSEGKGVRSVPHAVLVGRRRRVAIMRRRELAHMVRLELPVLLLLLLLLLPAGLWGLLGEGRRRVWTSFDRERVGSRTLVVSSPPSCTRPT